MTSEGVERRQGVLATLNELLETCRDGERGFRTAAADVDDADTRQVFESYARQRAEFAAELEESVRRLGGDAAVGGHAAAAAHRGWIDIKAVLTGRDAGAVLGEVERGEDQALKAYERALRSELPGDVRLDVERQYLEVKDAHDHVRVLRNAAAGR